MEARVIIPEPIPAPEPMIRVYRYGSYNYTSDQSWGLSVKEALILRAKLDRALSDPRIAGIVRVAAIRLAQEET